MANDFPGDGMKDVAGRMAEPLKAAGEALKGAGAKAAENSSAMSLTVIDHAEQNTREAFAALRAAAKVTSPTELMKLQGDYVREQNSRAMEQARQIGELITRFGRDMMSPLGGKKD